MRIAILQPAYDIELYPHLWHVALVMSRAGHEVHFVSSARPKENTGAVRVHTCSAIPILSGTRLSRWYDLSRTVALLLHLKVELVMAHHSACLEALAYRRLRRLVGQSAFSVLYLNDYVGPEARWVRYVAKHIDEVDALIDIDVIRVQRRSEWMALPARVFVVSNCVPLRDTEEVTAPRGPVRIIFSGRPHPEMHPDKLVAALAAWSGRGEFVWRMPVSRDMLSSYRSKIEHRVPHQSIRVLPGLTKAEFMAELNAFHAGLMWNPTAGQVGGMAVQYESCASNKLGEYIAASLMVMHTGNPGLRFLDQQGIGAGVDPEEPESLGLLLDRLADDPAALLDMRRKARAFYRNVFHLEHQLAPVLEWLDELDNRLALDGMPKSRVGA